MRFVSLHTHRQNMHVTSRNFRADVNIGAYMTNDVDIDYSLT